MEGKVQELRAVHQRAFPLLVFAGSTFSYFSVSRVLDYFLSHYELYVWSTFFGMIIGSIYYVAKDFNDFSRINVFFISLGILIGVSISLLDPAKENDNLCSCFSVGSLAFQG